VKAYKKDDACIGAAVECLTQAIDLHINNGRFSQVLGLPIKFFIPVFKSFSRPGCQIPQRSWRTL
jgi:hypothetical protein